MRRLVLAFAATLLFMSSSPVEAQSELERARQRVEELQAEVDALFEGVKEAQNRVDAAAESFWQADHDLHVLQHENAEAEREESEMQAAVKGLRERITEIAVARYIDSATPPTILAGSDIGRQAALDALDRFIREGSLDIVDDYRLALDDLAAVQVRLSQQTERQRDLLSDLAENQSRLSEDLAEIADSYLQVVEKLNAQDRILNELEEEERQRLAEELKRRQEEQARRIEAARRAAAEALEARERERQQAARTQDQAQTADSDPQDAADSPSLQTASGWVCPLAGPFSHTDDFGAPRHHGRWHKGNDLIAPTGTPILATEDGRVRHAYNNVGGNSAFIYADSGNYYYNTHLSAYENVGAGWVPAGTVIGYVGETGNAPIPHLHFEFHQGGRGNPINPYPIVREACF